MTKMWYLKTATVLPGVVSSPLVCQGGCKGLSLEEAVFADAAIATLLVRHSCQWEFTSPALMLPTGSFIGGHVLESGAQERWRTGSACAPDCPLETRPSEVVFMVCHQYQKNIDGVLGKAVHTPKIIQT